MPLSTSMRNSDLRGSLYALSASMNPLNLLAVNVEEVHKVTGATTEERATGATEKPETVPIPVPSGSQLSAETGSALSPKCLFSPSSSSKHSNDFSMSMATFSRPVGGPDESAACLTEVKRRLSVGSLCCEEIEMKEQTRSGKQHLPSATSQPAAIVGPKLSSSPSGSLKSDLSVKSIDEVSLSLCFA